jgi:ribosomal protein S18 acetylase RimI-like enzyme
MNKQSLAHADGRLTLRAFQDRGDFEIIARIRNASARKHQGERVTPLDADVFEDLSPTPARLCIAQVDQEPVGSILALGAGTQQLDEFGTVEGRSWIFIGPTCVPQHEGKGIERALLDWLAAHAQKARVARLIRFVKELKSHAYTREILEQAGFRERLRYYYMQLELTAPPPTPRELPGELKLVNFGGQEDFDLVWSILKAAFDYIERHPGSYEQAKLSFGSLESAYFPICLEAGSERPVGTIALAPAGNHGRILTFGVIPSFQKRGIGSLLMARALHQAWNLGLRTVDLSVRVENPQAISIYRRFGFQNVPERTTIVLLRDL